MESETMSDLTATMGEALEPLKRLTKDLLKAAATLSVDEARYLVDAYYILQRNRITAANQGRTLEDNEEPHTVIDWLGVQNKMLESQLKNSLDKWSSHSPVGQWAKSICGIGPVIAAGLLAHIDITRAPTAGHIWAFAGLDPSRSWDKGQKRPYNAKLKTLTAFKLGESFVKVQANEHDVYGRVFAHRKQIETARNEALTFADLARQRLPTVSKATDAYKAYSQGKLPPAHIHARARRYAVKLFLAHYHMVAYFVEYQTMPAFPYVFSHMEGHVHYIAPPHADLIPGLPAAVKQYEQQLRERGTETHERAQADE
jgi:hypothetical protein